MNVTRRQLMALLAAASLSSIVTRATRAQTPTALAPSYLSGLAKPRIYMVTWRGKTDTERGFAEYLRTRAVSAELIWRDAAQSRERLDAIANEISASNADLVYAWGTPPALGLAGSHDRPHPTIGKRIPLVFAAVADPIGAKLVRSLTQSERNLTGVIHVPPVSAQWRAMQQFHRGTRIGIIFNSQEPNAVATVATWRQHATDVGGSVIASPFAIEPSGAATIDGIDEIVASLATQRVDWLCLGPDSFLFTHIERIARAATSRGLRTFASVESHLNSDAPVLAGLVSKLFDVGQFAAKKSLQRLATSSTLTGASSPAPIPIESLQRFSLVVRLDTAKKLDAYPPLAMIDYAEFRR
jgi:putative tryptophan/tyrosine transport system substrate-binding protein